MSRTRITVTLRTIYSRRLGLITNLDPLPINLPCWITRGNNNSISAGNVGIIGQRTWAQVVKAEETTSTLGQEATGNVSSIGQPMRAHFVSTEETTRSVDHDTNQETTDNEDQDTIETSNNETLDETTTDVNIQETSDENVRAAWDYYPPNVKKLFEFHANGPRWMPEESNK